MTPPRPAPRARSGSAAAPTDPESGLPPEIALFGSDPELLRQLRVAAPSASIVIARNGATLSNVLKAGRCAALVLDAGAAGPAAVVAVMRIYRKFPSLPVIAVGTREDESRLVHLISTGRIYRFLHRPVSGARARHFLDSALRHHRRLGTRRSEPPPRSGPRQWLAMTMTIAIATAGRRLGLVLATTVVVVVAGLALGRWLPTPAHAVSSRRPPAATAGVPPTDPLPTDATRLPASP